MVSASLRMLLDDGDDLELSESTSPPTCISSSTSSVEADARLLLSLASPVKATSLASISAAAFPPASRTASRTSTPSFDKTCSTLLRSIALQSQQAPLVSPTSSSSTPSTPSLANIVDASLLFQDHHPNLRATTPCKAIPPSTPAARNAPPHSNMVILRELSDLEHSMTCEFCNSLYASPDTLRKHIFLFSRSSECQLSRHGAESRRQSAVSKKEVARPRQRPRHPSPHRQASHNRRLPLRSPIMPRPPDKPALQENGHISDSRYPPHPPHNLSRTLSLEQPHHQQQQPQPQKQYQTQSRDNEQLFAEHLYHRQRVLPPPFTSPHHSTPDRIELKKSQHLSSHTGLYLPSPQSRSGTETAVTHFTPIAVDYSHRPPQMETIPQQQQQERKPNNTVRLPSLKAALEMTLEETESPCSSCIQRGERCFRDLGNKACRSCLVTARSCDLRPRQHADNNAPTPSKVNRATPPVAKAHPHPPFHALPPEPRQTVPYTSAQNLGLNDTASSLSVSSPQPIELVQDPEENDKFKLPRASKPAPPPDEPAFSSSSLTRETASHLYHSRQSRSAPVPFVPGTQPVVYQSTAPSKADGFVALRLELAATSRAARHAEERRQLSFQTGTIQRSQSDPCLLPAIRINANGPATNASSHSVYAKSRNEPPYREQQNLPNQINGFSASFSSTQPQLQQSQHDNAPISQANRKNSFQNSIISVRNLSAPPGAEQVSFGHKRWLENSDASSEVQNKRVKLASPEEGSLPEDKRGTTVKRPRKTIGVWQTRRPQTACEDCRSKKLGCTVEPGRTSCERCIRKNLPCYLKIQ